MFTKIDLCSMALLKLGEKPIQSLADDSAAAQLARTLFDPITDTLIASHPWRFAMRTYELTKNNDDDFIIPSDVLRILQCPGQIQNGTRVLFRPHQGQDKPRFPDMLFQKGEGQ